MRDNGNPPKSSLIDVDRDIPLGIWPQVEATIRLAEEWELSGATGVADTRVVEFYRTTDSGMHVIHDTGCYSPLREPDLLGDFIHVFAGSQPPSDRAVISFYRRYGPMRDQVTVDGELIPAWAAGLEPAVRQSMTAVARLGLCEPLWWVRELANEVRLTYGLYDALREGRSRAVRMLLGGVPAGKRIVGVGMLAGRIVRDVTAAPEPGTEDSTPEARAARRSAGSVSLDLLPAGGESTTGERPLDEAEARHWGLTLLAAQLNRAERKTRREWIPRNQLLPQVWGKGEPVKVKVGKPALVWTCRFEGLSTAIYLQIAGLAQRSIGLRQCPGCQRLFYSLRHNRRYCDKYCGDAARQRKYYREQHSGPKDRRRPR